MAKKKPARRTYTKKASPRRAPAPRRQASAPQRKETVRVKTFIVEKPVIIQEPVQTISSRRRYAEEADEYPAQIFDSEKSPFLKRKAQRERARRGEENHEDLLGEGGEYDDQGLPEEKAAEEEMAAGEEEAPAEGEESLEEGAEAEMAGEESDADYAQAAAEGPGVPLKHARSRGLFMNVWWKKALLWAVLIWLLILGIELGMQALGLVIVDLSRDWWMLLGIVMALSLVYQKFFSGKIKI